MRIFLFLALLLLHFTGVLLAQKKPLSHSTPNSWPDMGTPTISNNGKFVAYVISVPNKERNCIIQAIDQSWKKELPGVGDCHFTADSRRIFFKNQGDSLGMLELGTENSWYIPEVNDFKVPEEGDGQWLFYRLKDSAKTLVTLNLFNKEEKHYSHIEDYLFNSACRTLLLQVSTMKDSIQSINVVWVDLASKKQTTICHDCQTNKFVFDKGGKNLAFLAKSADGKMVVRYYQQGMDSASVIVNPLTPGMAGMSLSEDYIFFDKEGNRIFFYVQRQDDVENGKPSITGATVAIQGVYDDVFTAERARKGSFLAVIPLKGSDRKVTRLQQEGDNGEALMVSNFNWVITRSHIIGDELEGYQWPVSARPNVYLISTRDGSRRLLKERLQNTDLFSSWSGKYVVWFDRMQRQWFCYNIAKNSTKNISGRINTPVYRENDRPNFPLAEGIAGWLENDAAVLIYDRYDIWQVDPEGIKLPVNITHGYGYKNKIKFQYVDFNMDHPIPIHPGDTLLLSAFNLVNKYDGFFQLVVGNGNLKELVMMPKAYTCRSRSFCGGRYPGPIVKAKEKNVYVIPWMSATEYPNWYVTSDFRAFKPLTDLAPQKEYNWYTSELVHWKLFDGRQAEGILYKPENFDPGKKYPIIFYYYEKNAQALNTFIHPELSDGTMSIPWFASNGYLVFVPDIYYKIGHAGQSAYNSVVSAALYLSKKPWVDARRMGLQGHSYGGFETNYIVSHSFLFAAAAPASGVSDMISAYGELGYSLSFHERSQPRMGATLWEKPELYIENSPVFNADKVSAAVLLMHTKDDDIIFYSQASQLYNELHRLGKKAWFLLYSGDNHVLLDEKNKLDYSIRLGQFFDHFLKGMPAPKWIVGGGANEKETEKLVDLEASGK